MAIARALGTDPELVLCDEPTGNLDSAAGRQILALLRTLPEPGQRAVVMVTYNPQAAAFGDRLIPICDGRVKAEETLEVLNS